MTQDRIRVHLVQNFQPQECSCGRLARTMTENIANLNYFMFFLASAVLLFRREWSHNTIELCSVFISQVLQLYFLELGCSNEFWICFVFPFNMSYCDQQTAAIIIVVISIKMLSFQNETSRTTIPPLIIPFSFLIVIPTNQLWSARQEFRLRTKNDLRGLKQTQHCAAAKEHWEIVMKISTEKRVWA